MTIIFCISRHSELFGQKHSDCESTECLHFQLCLFIFFVFFFLDSMQSELFVNRTVGQLLFEGYEDELLALAEMVGEKSRTPLDRFGYFYKVNDNG